MVGCEEVCLIYFGVFYLLVSSIENCLVFDIGGGLIEFIIGCEFELLLIESLYLGCVFYWEWYFFDGKIIE